MTSSELTREYYVRAKMAALDEINSKVRAYNGLMDLCSKVERDLVVHYKGSFENMCERQEKGFIKNIKKWMSERQGLEPETLELEGIQGDPQCKRVVASFSYEYKYFKYHGGATYQRGDGSKRLTIIRIIGDGCLFKKVSSSGVRKAARSINEIYERIKGAHNEIDQWLRVLPEEFKDEANDAKGIFK